MSPDPFRDDSVTDPEDLLAELAAVGAAAAAGRATRVGFPVATDIDYSPLAPLFAGLLNNIGDPWTDPAGTNHTKQYEREVLDWFGDLFRAPATDRWGYLTSGGTEGNLYALYLARARFPKGLVYYSADAHYSLPKCVDILGMDAVVIRTDERGEMDYDDLARMIDQHRDRPAIVVATCGTTMTEAADDVPRIRRILARAAVRHHLHVDGALAGVPLALADDGSTLRLDTTIDSVSISGYKFLGTPVPCGVVLTRRTLQQQLGQTPNYTATVDTTISGSRSGHPALLLWYAIRSLGHAGMRERADRARELAAYTVDRLNEVDWPAWRHEHAFTVVFPTPPAEVTAKWVLASSDGRSHLICMPGVTKEGIDAFVADLAAAVAPRAHRRRAPVPRSRRTAETPVPAEAALSAQVAS
ncbi:histidine decarboxylase [Micromonospora auratinigra]|uniref:L-histidine carboxy-lyase (Histamine-forming) n=1 Tax=Micromonospora auratinigra TaxID=261654 RepID=A0A1A8ZJ94_9ACTN|nr:histidine decarboxylase [Micromonospora auratinigra]SBT44124.1 L-histidine carboxy-lyase (histamine-forming) [Micromonospora auratinigra]